MMQSFGLRLKSVNRREFFRFFVFSTAFAAVALLTNLFGPLLAAVMLAGAALAILGFFDFPKFLLASLFVRSALDGLQAVAIPLGPLNLNPAGAFGLAIIFFSALHLFWRKRLWSFPVVKGWTLFLLFSVPAVLTAFLHFGAGGAVAVKEFIRLLSLLALLISLLAHFRSPEEMKKLFWASLTSLVIPLGVGFYQAAAGTGDMTSTAGQNRIFGTLFHPNTFALYLSVFVAVTLFWHRQAPSLGKKFLLGLLLAAEFLTFSLTGLAAAAVIFLFYFKKTKNFRAIALGALVFAGVLLSANWKHRFEQLSQMNLAAEIQSGEISNSFSWRVLHWYVLFQNAKEHPIAGWGLLTTEKVTPWKTETGQGYAAHNDAVRIFLEAGIIGLIGYLIFLFSTGRWIFRSKGGAKPGSLRPALKAVFAALLVLSFGAAEPLVHTAFVYYFFAFLALERNGFDLSMLNTAPKPVDENIGGKP